MDSPYFSTDYDLRFFYSFILYSLLIIWCVYGIGKCWNKYRLELNCIIMEPVAHLHFAPVTNQCGCFSSTASRTLSKATNHGVAFLHYVNARLLSSALKGMRYRNFFISTQTLSGFAESKKRATIARVSISPFRCICSLEEIQNNQP